MGERRRGCWRGGDLKAVVGALLEPAIKPMPQDHAFARARAHPVQVPLPLPFPAPEGLGMGQSRPLTRQLFCPPFSLAAPLCWPMHVPLAASTHQDTGDEGRGCEGPSDCCVAAGAYRRPDRSAGSLEFHG